MSMNEGKVQTVKKTKTFKISVAKINKNPLLKIPGPLSPKYNKKDALCEVNEVRKSLFRSIPAS